MRAASPMLTIALASRTPFWSADLFTFTLIDGSKIYLTSADRPITTQAGVTYPSVGPLIQRSSWSVKNDCSNVTMQFKLYSSGSDFSLGNLKRLMHQGYLDGASVQLDRAFMPEFGDTTLGTVLLFTGKIGQVNVTALGADITANAATVSLDQYLPKNTYQLGCLHTLYDSGCTVDRAAHTQSFTVASANRGTILFSEAQPADETIYALGTLTITSGAGVGQRRTITGLYQNAVGLAYPLLTVPSPGDTFTMTEGCNKSTARCQQFNNLQHFRGFPYIPPAMYGL